MDSKAEGLREELEAARQQVVSSPARLKSDVEHMTRLVEDAQVGAAAAAAEAASLQCRSEVVAKATKDVRKTLLLLGELETEVLRLKRVHKEAKARAAAKEDKAAEVADLQSQVERMERRVKAAEEKLAEQKHSAYVKQEATQRANQALREELQNSQNELDRARGSQKEAANRMGTIKTEVRARKRERGGGGDRACTLARPSALNLCTALPRLALAARPHPGGAQRRDGRDGVGDAQHPEVRLRLPRPPLRRHGQGRRQPRRGGPRLLMMAFDDAPPAARACCLSASSPAPCFSPILHALSCDPPSPLVINKCTRAREPHTLPLPLAAAPPPEAAAAPTRYAAVSRTL